MKKSSKTKKKIVKPSMKEAFEKIKVKRVKEKSSRKISGVRGFWWTYPDFLQRIVRNTRPLSYILFFGLLATACCFYLVDSSFLERVKVEEKTEFVEGSVGAISSLNPMFLTQNPVDKSIHELVFEKFIEIDHKGNPIPGIATEWSKSNDSLSYTFDIENGHYWQDGEPLTIDDVVFTFESAIKLAEKYGEDSVGVPLVGMEIEKIDGDSLKFKLENTNATFFEAVSIYILPKHRLENINLGDLKFDIFTKYPLGSGPYKVIKSEPNIVVMEASEYFPEEIGIPKFTYRIYEDIESLEIAFRNCELDAISGIDSGNMGFVHEYSEFKTLEASIDHRMRMIFFNNRRESLSNVDVRQALSFITNKEKLLEESGVPGEVAVGIFSSSSWAFNSDAQKYIYSPEKAAKLFKEVGYEKNDTSGYFEGEDNKILSFTLSYFENDLNTRLVNTLKELWREEGVILNLEPLSYAQITQEVVSTRNFEMILYEVETTVDPDQYNLWHSLKKDYPDLNLSGYEYDRVDILLEEGRTELNKSVRKEKYDLFQKYLMDDAPAIFLYRPTYMYVVPLNMEGPDLNEICYPEDRFRNIADWNF